MNKSDKKKSNKKSKYGEEIIDEQNIDIQSCNNEELIAKGFDRGMDFTTVKSKIIDFFNKNYEKMDMIDKDDEVTQSQIRILINKINYCIISLIQLRNGSRISEACVAFRLFMNNCEFEKKVIVKIAKSDSIKYKKDTKEKYKTKARYRKMMFPLTWINEQRINVIKDNQFTKKLLKCETLKKRTLDFLLKYFDCNTHSLRYAFINYMLYEEKRPMNDVAKFVGHVDMSMLVRYTQIKNTEKIFDMNL
jgi:hypothetical protein